MLRARAAGGSARSLHLTPFPIACLIVLFQAAIAAELEAKNKLEDVLKKRREEQRLLEDERNAIKRVRPACEMPLSTCTLHA